MILSFKTKINDKPTYFPEKIITGLFKSQIISREKAIELFYPQSLMKMVPMEYHGIKSDVAISKVKFDNSIDHSPKIHTIRKDDKNRWKPGIMIDFFINARHKDMFRFAPRIPVVSTQKIRIIHLKDTLLGVVLSHKMYVLIDGKRLSDDEIDKLAINDGFKDGWAFFEYFNEDFEGKIIHWTNLQY